jgi:uncharacterized circularly permuted ATP-grasp superfamily protein
MPSVATWWCGEPSALEAGDRQARHAGRQAQLPADARNSRCSAPTWRAPRARRFIAQLRATPNQYVAQELVRLSQAPVWKDGAPDGLQALRHRPAGVCLRHAEWLCGDAGRPDPGGHRPGRARA